MDIDLLAHVLFGSQGTATPQSLWEARAVAGLKLSPSFALFGGLAFDVLQVPKGQAARAYDGAVLSKTVQAADNSEHLSPALVAGVRGL